MSSIFLTVNGQATFADLHFFIGTWKVEGKETYEVWEVFENNSLIGYGYKMKEGEKIILENLSISMEQGKIIYSATVSDQNNGSTIPFVLNPDTLQGFSFENIDHDFPKKIIYKKISDTELAVQVLGANDQGFKLKLIKQ